MGLGNNLLVDRIYDVVKQEAARYGLGRKILVAEGEDSETAFVFASEAIAFRTKDNELSGVYFTGFPVVILIPNLVWSVRGNRAMCADGRVYH